MNEHQVLQFLFELSVSTIGGIIAESLPVTSVGTWRTRLIHKARTMMTNDRETIKQQRTLDGLRWLAICVEDIQISI